jgi:hypothetical protein
MPVSLERRHELFYSHASLLKNTRQGANFELAMIGDNATNGRTTKHDVTTLLPDNYKAKSLQRTDGLSP